MANEKEPAFSATGTLVVPKDGVRTVPDPRFTNGSFKNHSGPLFSRAPNLGDVQQGAIGDCYLLAALNAILSRPNGMDVIQGMMKDEGNGNVTFRVFEKGKPQYIRVRKSYAYRTVGMAMHNRGAAWVSILEKAYAAVFRGGVYNDPKMNNSKGAVLVGLSGGDAHTVMLQLLGEGKQVTVPNALISLAMLTTNMAGGYAAIAEHKKIISDYVFQNDGPDQPNATKWAFWNVGSKQKALMDFIQSNSISSEKFVALLQRIGQDLSPVTRGLVIEWALSSNLGQGAIGTGLYTPQQLDFFAKVARLLATQRSVAVSTKTKLKGPVTGRGHSGGEEYSKGLYASHVYTVLDCKVDSRSRRFFKLRNPHGDGFLGRMRAYQETSAHLFVATTVKTAESWIELTDFYENFDLTAEVGPQIHNAARQNLMTNLDQQLQAQKAKLTPRVDLNARKKLPGKYW